MKIFTENHTRAFTLVEVMFAAAISTLLGAAIFGAFVTLSRSSLVVEKNLEFRQKNRYFVDAFTKDARSAQKVLSVSEGEFNGETITNGISFVLPTTNTIPRYYRVTYLQEGSNLSRKVEMGSDPSSTDDADWMETDPDPELDKNSYKKITDDVVAVKFTLLSRSSSPVMSLSNAFEVVANVYLQGKVIKNDFHEITVTRAVMRNKKYGVN